MVAGSRDGDTGYFVLFALFCCGFARKPLGASFIRHVPRLGALSFQLSGTLG